MNNIENQIIDVDRLGNSNGIDPTIEKVFEQSNSNQAQISNQKPQNKRKIADRLDVISRREKNKKRRIEKKIQKKERKEKSKISIQKNENSIQSEFPDSEIPIPSNNNSNIHENINEKQSSLISNNSQKKINRKMKLPRIQKKMNLSKNNIILNNNVTIENNQNSSETIVDSNNSNSLNNQRAIVFTSPSEDQTLIGEKTESTSQTQSIKKVFTPQKITGKAFRKQLSNIFENYKAAGVIPYRFNVEKNEIELLLGQEIRRHSKIKSWCEFGGKRENRDTTVFDTVAREFSEETCGVLSGNLENPSIDSLNSSIETMKNILLKCFPRKGKRFMNIAPYTYLSEHSVESLSLQSYASFAKYAIFVIPLIEVDLPDVQSFENCVQRNNDPEYQNSIPEAQKETYKWYSLNEIKNISQEDKDFLYPFFSRMLKFLQSSIEFMQSLIQNKDLWKERETKYYLSNSMRRKIRKNQENSNEQYSESSESEEDEIN